VLYRKTAVRNITFYNRQKTTLLEKKRNEWYCLTSAEKNMGLRTQSFIEINKKASESTASLKRVSCALRNDASLQESLENVRRYPNWTRQRNKTWDSQDFLQVVF